MLIIFSVLSILLKYNQLCLLKQTSLKGVKFKKQFKLIMATPTSGGITAYSVKTKTKNVPMLDPTIDVKSEGILLPVKTVQAIKWLRL